MKELNRKDYFTGLAMQGIISNVHKIINLKDILLVEDSRLGDRELDIIACLATSIANRVIEQIDMESKS